MTENVNCAHLEKYAELEGDGKCSLFYPLLSVKLE